MIETLLLSDGIFSSFFFPSVPWNLHDARKFGQTNEKERESEKYGGHTPTKWEESRNSETKKKKKI